MSIDTQVELAEWGTTLQGDAIHLVTLRNSLVEVKVCTYGARMTSVRTRDRNGDMGEITLGSDDLAVYLSDRKTYMGAIVGRFANRIAGGRFTLDGRDYQVPLNDGPNSLHGGSVGFDQKLWTAHLVADGVCMSYLSADGEMGFPGNLMTKVTYTLSHNSLRLDYRAMSDQPTIVNLTNHAYFNLSGQASEIAEHTLRLNALSFTPIDSTLIPTGEVRSVADSPLDFRSHKAVGLQWGSEDEQIALAGGYDHNWVLEESGEQPRLAAEVVDPDSGRKLSVSTTAPGIQFYSGNFLDGSFVGRNGSCERRTGFCLETQHFPDSPNKPAFPSARADERTPFRSTTVLVFH